MGLVPYSYPAPPQLNVGTSLDPEGIPWPRYFEALRRHFIVIVVIVIAGAVLGALAGRRVKPVYEAQSTVWIASGGSAQGGPIRPNQLLNQTSWVELMRSFVIVEPVVRKLRLNVSYKPTDSLLFTSFESLPSLKPGAYVLKIDSVGGYRLTTAKNVVVERGRVGDSIGRKIGFGWAPDARMLGRNRVIEFSVATPRSAAGGLLGRLTTFLPDDGQFLKITLSGSDPVRDANTLNAWVDAFVSTSNELKKRHLLELKRTLADQLGVAERQLQGSEDQLERFRISSITLPSAGQSLTTQNAADPTITSYFQRRGILAEVENERITLEELIGRSKFGPIDPQALLMLPAILTNTPQLRAAIDELSSRQASLRSEQQFLTDANPRIKQLSASVRLLQYETIPQILRSVLETLKTQERQLNSRLDSESSELRAIPARTIEETRLSRQVDANAKLYSVLKGRYEEATLAEAEMTPDLSVLDFAVPATHPNSNDASRLMLIIILASAGFAAGLALFHDRIDRRFRYPDQATHELGLTIAGTVPRLKLNADGELEVEVLSQLVESFRTLRLAMRYEFSGSDPVVLTVSSPSADDGKSLVASNLALAFANAGHRTLLVDGDLRCGTLHGTFGIQVTPGLIEYLCGTAGLDSVIKPIGTENLFLLPRGTRMPRAPELLVSERMATLIALARGQYDVVIIDSPPLIAGVDAYALAAAAGNILVVLRQGLSDRKLAAAKLSIVDRLPIRILGAVINGVPPGGVYRYYGTDYGGADGRNPVSSVATPEGFVVGA